jgi:hypothetical protein
MAEALQGRSTPSCCAPAWTPAALLRPLGLRLPLVAVHGYSVSAPMREPLTRHAAR